MSGTSADGVDASVIQSDGGAKYEVILDKYFQYDQNIYQSIHSLKEKINDSKDLKNLSKEIQPIEKEITLFHAKVVNEIIASSKTSIDFLGFHGQTIFHNAKEKISKQLGEGKLLSKLTDKPVIYNFRQNDLKNGGQGAPLAPVFHSIFVKNKRISLPVAIINIGGITNCTFINETGISSQDIGPGNCLIDQWVRINSKKKYDKDGLIARSGKRNRLILNQAFDNFQFSNKSSLDIKNFDISFAKGLSIEDGASTLTELTAELIREGLNNLLQKNKQDYGTDQEIIICGGGRKNKYLMELLNLNLDCKNVSKIDEYNIDGDFIESQAFAFLAIRSFLNLPISFPETTGCKKPRTGGVIVKNF